MLKLLESYKMLKINKKEQTLFYLIEAHSIQHQEGKFMILELSTSDNKNIMFTTSKKLVNAFCIIWIKLFLLILLENKWEVLSIKIEDLLYEASTLEPTSSSQLQEEF